MKSQFAFPMKLTLWLLLAALLGGPAFGQCLDSCYHTRAKIDTFVTALLAYDIAHYHVAHVDTIGWSRGDQLGIHYPLYAIKISNHPDAFEDKPTALFVGQVHAEEVIGIETMIRYIWRLDSLYGLYRTLLENTQLYFIPTANPDGLEIVSRNWDCTYRKNGYKPPQLDSCIIVPGMGQDSCGVDLNRNFGFNWIYGDTLWYPTALERFDYYRGPGPFSEPESRAVRDFATQIKPAISAVFHSSRGGTNAERSIPAWIWGGVRQSPDWACINALNFLYCVSEHFGGTTYHAPASTTRDGNLQDWFYRELGTIQFNTELGPPVNIQPLCPDLQTYATGDVVALNWLCERLLNLGHAAQAPVTIHTYDGPGNASPISAEWRYLNTWTAILDPWYTNAQFGSATTLLPTQGTARFMARKEGYADTTVVTTVYNSDPQRVSMHLRALPWHTLTLHLFDASGTPIAGHVYLDAEFPHTVDVPTGGANINLPEGNFTARASGEVTSQMVLWRSFYLGGDATENFYLPAAASLGSENFSSGLANWTAGGAGNPWRIGTDTTAHNFGNILSTNPADYRAQYADNLNATLTYNRPIDLTGGSSNVAYLTFWRGGRMDMPADSFFVEVQTNSDTTWNAAGVYSDLEVPWTQTYVNLTPWMGHIVDLRIRFKTDPALGDLGLNFANIAAFIGTDLAASDKPPVATAYSFRITGSYPNPFNPSTTISYETATPGLVTLVVFNTLGQEVRRFEVNVPSAGPQHLLWDGTTTGGASVGSGLYFIQLQAGHTVSTHKLLLMR